MYEKLNIQINDIFTNNKTTIDPKLQEIFKMFHKVDEFIIRFAKILSEKKIQLEDLQSLIKDYRTYSDTIAPTDFSDLSLDLIHSFMMKLEDLHFDSCTKMSKAQTSTMFFYYLMVSVAKADILWYECNQVLQRLVEG